MMNSSTHSFNDQQNQSAFAEVVASSLETFTAQCWEWDIQPRFGSLVYVNVQDLIIFGCVTQVKTGSLDPIRTPVAYKKTEEALRAEQPQIFEFLTTTFDAQVVGYAQGDLAAIGKILYMLPPYPSKIHAFVTVCPPEMTAHFFSDTSFLHLLFAFQANILNLDELLLSVIQQQSQAGFLNKEVFNNFCQTFSLLNGNDYRRTKLFLQRVAQVIHV